MPEPPKKDNSSTSLTKEEPQTITGKIIGTIDKFKPLENYPIPDLVKHAEEFGSYLKKQGLKTNQIRKFLDAVNRIKAKLTQNETEENKLNQSSSKNKNEAELEEIQFKRIKDEVILLKPKLAYAAARQRAIKPLNEVMSKAIDQVHTTKDFERLVQLIESIIAYHKAEGGE